MNIRCIKTTEYYLAIKKKWSTDIRYNTDESQKHYARWKKPDSKRLYTVGFHLYSILEKAKLRTEIGSMGRGSGTEDWLQNAKGHEGTFWDHGNTPYLDCGGS